MSTLEWSVQRGRSKLGCDNCKSRARLGCWHVKAGTQTVAVICFDCVHRIPVGWLPGDPPTLPSAA